MQTATQVQTTCRHCGALFTGSSHEEFCCRGCDSVFTLLQSKGLGHYYDLQSNRDLACPIPAKVSNENYGYCDDPYFIQEMSCNSRTMSFYLEGLHCTACLWLLEKTPELLKDCTSVQVRMSDSIVEVTRKPDGSFANIAKHFDRFGYTPHVVKQGSSEALTLKDKENRRDLIRIGVAGACTGNIMILAVSLYAGADGIMASQFRWISALIAAPVLIYCAWPFYKSTFNSFRNRHLNIDVPIVAAIVSGILISFWGLFSGAETLFFDSLSTLIFLLLSSRFLLKKIQQSHLSTSNLTSHLLLSRAERRTSDGSFETVSSLALKKGDVVRYSQPSLICADGEVIEGTAVVDTATLTGESVPHNLSEGDYVYAGTRALSGSWLLKVDNPAQQSRVAGILDDVQRSVQSKPKVVQLADKAAQWFIVIVFALAIGTFFYFIAAPVDAASRALALIIVTCPCVFGMAIPLSMSLAIKKAAESGIVIKDGNTLEKLTRISSIYFDKTGTLTYGDLEVTKSLFTAENRKHLSAAAALEQNQVHPVGRAIVKYLGSSTSAVSAQNVRLLSEGGITGEVNGFSYSVVPSELLSSVNGEIKMRYSLLFDQREVAQFELGDKVRSDAQDLFSWLKQNNFKARMLSGDRKEVALGCAREIGLNPADVIAQASPEQKSLILKSSTELCAMVGDGANDAAALASSAVGIAVTGSLDISLRAADVYLTRNKLSDIKTLFKIARQTKSVMKRNLAFSLCFNVVAGSLAITGHMTPLWAAIFMPLSSLTVLASSLRGASSWK